MMPNTDTLAPLPPAAAAVDASDIHALLRTGTREDHQRLDHHPLLRPLLTRDSPSDELAATLHGFHAAYSDLQYAGFPTAWQALDIGYHPLPYLDWLADDLRALGHEPGPSEPAAAEMPTDVAAQLGSLYVVAGSAMGATRIAALLGRHTDPRVRELAFFRNMATGAACFPFLMQCLRERVTDEAAARRALAAARSTFALFAHAFDRVAEGLTTGNHRLS